MNILFITHKFYPDLGGIEVNSEVLATEFYRLGHTVRLVTWTSEAGNKTFPFKVIRNPNLYTIVAEHLKADVVFENNPSLRLSWPNIVIGKRSVIALRTWVNRIDGSTAWQDKLKIRLLSKASAVIAVSEAIRKRCWPNAVVIGNPYRADLFRVIPGINRNKNFVFMGRLVSDKGADLAIKAIHKINSKSRYYTLTIIGSGPEKESLIKLVAQLRLQSQVRFTGPLSGEELVRTLNEHQFLLVPSIWEEPFGNVALEGMASGCIPIVSDGGGLPDAVGNAGLIVKRNDIEDLADAMYKLLNNPSVESELHNAAIGHLANHLPDVVSKRYLDVLEKVTS